jgi:endonuclease/exonuclease/phosphatase family metal-dependent hydrolase
MKLTIFDINMWLMPFPYSTRQKLRLRKLVEFINRKKPDIITMQEVPLKKHIGFLKKRLDYFFTYHGSFVNKSGLVIMSKIMPANTGYKAFPKSKGMSMIDRVVRRGILYADFLDDVRIYNTHLYHKSLDHRVKITLNEFQFLKDTIAEDKKCIICGDLNLNKEQFEKANNGFFKYAENTKNTFSFENKYLKKWWDPHVTGDKKIDYILVKSKTKFSFQSKLIKEEISDHYGIYSEIELN